MARLKFEDCGTCRNRRRAWICRDCDFGEFYEDAEIAPLDFSEGRILARADKSLVTDDDEPDMNPDDLIERIEREREEKEDTEDE